jgi:uncharacterized membrane protein YqhA
MSEDKKEGSAKKETWKDKIIIKAKSTGYYLRTGSRIALIFIAIFFFIGASVATYVGIINLIDILVSLTEHVTLSNDTKVIQDLIMLAEHFMIAITFFAICIALVYFSIPEPKEKELGKLGEIKDLEKYIFSMVIATISVIFLSGVLSVTTKLSNTSEILEFGIGIAVVIIALGVYIKYTTLTKEERKKFTKR